MTVIDRYISTTFNRPAGVVAKELGVSENFVTCRRMVLMEPKRPTEHTMGATEEIKALINIINDRKEGWVVDVAKSRIAYLEALARK